MLADFFCICRSTSGGVDGATVSRRKAGVCGSGMRPESLPLPGQAGVCGSHRMSPVTAAEVATWCTVRGLLVKAEGALDDADRDGRIDGLGGGAAALGGVLGAAASGLRAAGTPDGLAILAFQHDGALFGTVDGRLRGSPLEETAGDGASVTTTCPGGLPRAKGLALGFSALLLSMSITSLIG